MKSTPIRRAWKDYRASLTRKLMTEPLFRDRDVRERVDEYVEAAYCDAYMDALDDIHLSIDKLYPNCPDLGEQ